MRKNILFSVLLCCLLLFCSCSAADNAAQPERQTTDTVTAEREQIRAMWLSCYELSQMLQKGTDAAFSQEILRVFELCKEKGINTLFVQVRPFCDALYPSKLFAWSDFAKSADGSVPDFDPLKIIIDIAADYSVSVHAWINPYRVSYDSAALIPEVTQGLAFVCDKGVFLDPSSLGAQKLVLDGVREILENYAVDGIHIDDYFYPQTKDNFDRGAYEAYRDGGGRLSKGSWRRENINSLVTALYSLVHSVKPQAVFSISPAGNIEKNRSEHYADVELWCSRRGYADWIIPQIYYGFEHETAPFEETADKWLNLARDSGVKMICGLASYKQGKSDSGAGKGKNEWIENDGIVKRQAEYACAAGYDGYALFSYSSVAKQ